MFFRYQFAGKLGNNIKVNEIVHWLDMRKGQSVYVQAKFVVDTLNRYMSSSDQCITTAHVPACLINAGKNSKTTVHAATHEMQMVCMNKSYSDKYCLSSIRLES